MQQAAKVFEALRSQDAGILLFDFLLDLVRVLQEVTACRRVGEDGVATTMELPGTPLVVAEAAAAGFPLVEEAGSNFLRMPADFLIDADGIVLNAHYAEYVWDHTPLSWVIESGHLTPMSEWSS